jgi:P27 family predicted phage terminase small subunit
MKELAGTQRKGRSNPREPRGAPAALPPPPKKASEKVRAAWKRLAAIVDPVRVATAQDVVAFGEMTRAYAIVLDAQQSLDDAGGSPVYECMTQFGVTLKARPEIGIIAQYEKIIAYWFSRFGLTPADRSRVSQLGGDDAPDPLDEFGAPPRGA